MNIGILGYGTIGRGVAALIEELPAEYGVKTLKILDLPQKKAELGALYAATKEEICANPRIDTVVEVLGGNDFAYDCIVMALENGKNVVTSNKEVVSRHMEEFYALAKAHGAYFWCEAAVGGGIPLICSLIDQTAYNQVTEIYGIINGTTNFVLTKMKEEGKTLNEALETARNLGFAERDASADLEGLDMVRKISILSSIAYGGLVSFEKVGHFGIASVTDRILKAAEEMGKTLKFMAYSRRDGNEVFCCVEPVLLDKNHPLSAVNNEFNAVFLNCSRNGELMFYGKGAGSYPTASAVIADILRIKNKAKPYYFNNDAAFSVTPRIKGAKYYVVKNGVGRITESEAEKQNADFYARLM
ncbi:MAG: homoserine dehydrogenase [Candidatus Borkfalkiaceae bacterium]|nr:homoserine dehydrogenase [Clostridia bacterium]MDY6223114.1 homoserine dehydrogenase [Christensenellaceae bacterium]